MSRRFAHGITHEYLLNHTNLSENLKEHLFRVNEAYKKDPHEAQRLFKVIPNEFIWDSVHNLDAYQQVKNFLFKRSDPKTNHSARQEAISAFHAVEERNKSVKLMYNDPQIVKIREIIHRILGEMNDRCIFEIIDRARPGGGQSIGLWNKYRTSKTHKLVACDFTCTPKAAMYGKMFLERHAWGDYLREDRPLVPVVGTKLAFVPKNISTFRTIAVEPNVNMALQLGVHEYIVPRLLRHGIDLRDQSVNQAWAKHGSIFGDLATVDFSSASDTISDTLAFHILPRAWYNFLNKIRCDRYDLDGTVEQQSKFSTMGNGFTFALESVMFYAIARSVSDGTISVFGDDVILETRDYSRFIELSEKLGLIPNRDKSFSTGPFRESCGTDWWRGVCITPLRLQDERVTRNTLHRLYNNWGKRPSASAVKKYLIKYSKESFDHVLYGLANELDDSCFFTTFAYAKGSGLLSYHKGHQTYTFKGLVLKGIRDDAYPDDWRYTHALLYGAVEAEVRNTLKDCVKAVIKNLTAGVHLRTHTYRAHKLNL